MTGFIRGLFGRKKQKEQNTIKQQQPSEAYFLDNDAAKTYGNIDFMRTSKQVRRTFPKGQRDFNVGETERYIDVSSMEERKFGNSQPTPSVGNTPGAGMNANSNTNTSNSSNLGESFERRQARTDTSMDMFRNMAKDVKRR
ncbi:hypothetical protein E1H12_18570 [Geitlerinema sp. P-1104]|uniref:hypothetical protein n=1 Tax=Geitlerinema sp. P-1104 TaxID=2546230 RepID=UPI00147773C9|nr:hypothetical protein [Geitlerinema sp. P-1104]NMG60462.1 hypothetical protein [Geitlerinema sp. P-1104]